jgi:hypothetical protein
MTASSCFYTGYDQQIRSMKLPPTSTSGPRRCTSISINWHLRFIAGLSRNI